MLKLIPVVAMLFFPPASGPEQNTGVQRLRDVKTVYVADLGRAESSKTLRKEIIKELSESNRVRVVSTLEEADAVLDVDVKESSKNEDKVLSPFESMEMKTGSQVVPVYKFTFRLNNRNSRGLWKVRFNSDEIRARNWDEKANTMADRMSRELVKALDKDSRKRQ